MTLDTVIAAALSALFVGWILIVLLAFFHYLATSYIHYQIEFLEGGNPNAAATEITRLRRYEDEWFPANLGFATYHIWRRIGMATCQAVHKEVDMATLMVWGLVVLCG